ncbi:hypothetical protein OVA26_15745 [Microbacterium sp. SL62]|uniref:hypothetical protein n=1 Tax=Microbacterium sp. SL62 TaxID=2995139 RepID=UPI002275AB42|nr:hypothetical protein [Microbacterium sp. SL62]MCY1718388.1 hypothetical protein [Microbacterium sp. SL62]
MVTEADEMIARVQARADRAIQRAGLAVGMTFDQVVHAVEQALEIRLRIVPETDTAGWGTLTGFLTYFADRREGSIHVRASDAAIYSQFAASHELGHLLDDAHCSGALHERSSVSPHDNPLLTTPEYEAELVAEHIAHRIARLLYTSPRVAESSW